MFKLKFYKILPIIFIFLTLSAGTLYVQPCHAQQDIIDQQMNAAQKGSGLGNLDPRTIAAMVIRGALSLLGIIFFGLVVYAGYLWMTAGGNEEDAGRAKKLLTQAVIGLCIVLAAYSITIYAFQIATLQTTSPSNGFTIHIPF